jgi:type III secretion protein J
MDRRCFGLLVLLLNSLLLAGCKETLFARLTEPQANEVVAALAEARIEVAKSRIDENTWQIEVEGGQIGQALVMLRNRGLPSQPTASLGDVFKKDGMISSPQEERARYAFALQEGISATLRRIDGVVDARVHVVIPQNDPLSSRVMPATASVLMRHRRNVDMQMLGPSIKSIVMASVEGLDIKNIALLALPVEQDAVVESPLRDRAGFMDAQASTSASAKDAAPAHLAGGPWFGLAAAGVAAAAVLAWWRRQRRAYEQVAGGISARASDDEEAASSAPVPTQRERPVRLVLTPAPTAHPGLFDTPGGKGPSAS